MSMIEENAFTRYIKSLKVYGFIEYKYDTLIPILPIGENDLVSTREGQLRL